MSITTPDALEHWLLDSSAPLPSIEQLRRGSVAAYAYVQLPAGHPGRAALRGNYVSAFVRHLKAKAELLPLLRAWHAAGVEVLLFKGFPLSEFTYPRPGTRWYSDVDLLIRPADAAAARRVADDLGWAACEDDAFEVWTSHTLFTLQRGAGVKVDVHRWPVHASLPLNRVHHRITEAVWRRSRHREWEGITIRLPDPVDALLVGLVLQRTWGDGFNLRPGHALDFQLLEREEGVTRAALQARARELRCERTLDAFLQQYDPAAGRLSLAPPAALHAERRRALFAERGDLFFRGLLKRAYQFGPALRWLPQALLALRRARRAVRSTSDAERLRLLLGDAPVPARAPVWDQVIWAPHAVRWAVRLARPAPAETAQLAALTLFALLRHHGLQAELVGAGAAAQVTLEGRPLPARRTGRGRPADRR